MVAPSLRKLARTGPSTLKLGESLMHHTHGSSSFADGRSHPLDASSAGVAYSEYSWEAAFEQRGGRERGQVGF